MPANARSRQFHDDTIRETADENRLAKRCTVSDHAPRARRERSVRISVFAGDVCDVPAEALCSSTNPRLSLLMGSGASILNRGGYQILRACEQIVDAEFQRSGKRGLPAGSGYPTIAGDLPARIIVHCVASDASHRSSTEIIRNCVRNALAISDAKGCRSIAMPLFATGHARFNFDRALLAMAETLRDESTSAEHVFIVVYDPDRADGAARLIRSVIPTADIDVQRGPQKMEEPLSAWSDDRD